MPVYLKQGYKQSTRDRTEGIASTGEVSPNGTVTHTDHWDGRVDATVKPQAYGMRLTPISDAPPNPAHVEAVAALQEAAEQIKYARAANDPAWIRRASHQYNQAKDRVLATQ